MSKSLSHSSPFDAIRQVDKNGREFWSARDLQEKLGYTDWRNFEDSIEKAMISCQIGGQNVSDHWVVGVTKPIISGKGRKQELKDYHMTRYACYQTAQNGDVRKPEIANAQRYFIVKAREAEIHQQSSKPKPRKKYLQRLSLNKDVKIYGYMPALSFLEEVNIQYMDDVIVFSETTSPDISMGQFLAKRLPLESWYDAALVKKPVGGTDRSKWNKEIMMVVYVTDDGYQMEREVIFYPRKWYPEIWDILHMEYFPEKFPKYLAGMRNGIVRCPDPQQRKLITERVNYF
jgi:hypothetical protein